MNPTETFTNPKPEPHLPHLPALLAVLLLPMLGCNITADDWPQWMGPERDGKWREDGITEVFDTNGPPLKWRVPINPGYVGPAVASNRLFLMDRLAGKPVARERGDRSLPTIPGNERLLCLDATTGRMIWEHVYDCPYAIDYPAGPRATPLVSGDRVYTLGAMGDLRASAVADGKLIWARSLPRDYATAPPVWGYASHPILDGDRLIVPVGGTNSAIVAFHNETGVELWRALTAHEIGYAPPVIHEVAGRRQLIFWHPDAISGLEPETGKVLWTHAYPVGGRPQRPEVTIAMPRLQGDQLFLTSFYQGALLLQVPPLGEDPRVIWNRRSTRQSEVTEGLATVMSTPVIHDGFIVQQADRYWIWNDHGELMVGKLTPSRFELISRAKILEPAENTRGRDVLWCHPAFAGRSAYMHNGRELICLDLAKGASRAG